MLEHGGKLLAASQRYGIPLDRWIDLSTGIHPIGWPVPPIPAECWQRLPEDDDGLLSAAAEYYGTSHLIACAGSQAAIQILPMLRPPSRVGILSPTYAEHAHAWQRAGHQVEAVSEMRPDVDVLVLANPNNPTGRLISPNILREWHAELAGRGGWLVVDEAFMDAMPENSLAADAGKPGLVILRSIGKFFGLAGIRAGFLLAWPELLSEVQERLGPWSVPAPSRWVAQQALRDTAWQADQRPWLTEHSKQLAVLLARHGLAPNGGTALFQWVCSPEASAIHERLARLGILTRLFSEPASLRFGLPGNERAWMKLDYLLSV
ncbi:cobalamin biosynthetic protein CobC [Novimethylophilus kurashikiensis]|uniref:threonine-phosphate decarboxylase n=1 Tax=Novimethylophilus kurashikiensis TaxID=1825523 RepID=A0A2R5FAW8_9PROT|nr:threonine-phosphate decarboxylase CobD [Novimethylophilus kurashikiensis]GBG13831.1 cobalamin biosynthetic protein CobC [Novimethylophilus kurashikiensis]